MRTGGVELLVVENEGATRDLDTDGRSDRY